MATFFLVIIYLAFISLGLPDSLLGSAWPVMRLSVNASLDSAGIISMIITVGTIISSLLSEKIINRFGTGKVTFFSVLATAVALLGFSYSPSFVWLIIFSIPLGLGAGSVDAGLNNFVALHYKSYHMSWLHCFWGIGATFGPIIMAHFLQIDGNWRSGYLVISIIQFALVFILLFSLPQWKKIADKSQQEIRTQNDIDEDKNNGSVFNIKGVKLSLIAFLAYCAVESTTGLWGSSFLVNAKNLSPALAARWIAMYYAGITVGRLISGFITMKMKSNVLIRIGQIICLIGALLLIMPLPSEFSLFGLILIGLGCAPIFPSMLHETPYRFGKSLSQKIMGLQMAFAYVGSATLPPLLGFIAERTSIVILPFYITLFILTMLVSSELINVVMNKKKRLRQI